MPKCHATDEYVEYHKDCMECHSMSCPMNMGGFAGYPLPDDINTLRMKRDRKPVELTDYRTMKLRKSTSEEEVYSKAN